MKLTNNQIAVLRRANRILEKVASYERGFAFESHDQAIEFFSTRLQGLEHEVFCVAFLDSKHALISCDNLFSGTINAASVYPREVAKKALEYNAAAVMISHNHPSGDATPSTQDIRITGRLIEALDLIDVQVLDHVVVGHKCQSLAQLGHM